MKQMMTTTLLELVRRDVPSIAPEATLREAAEQMLQLDVGEIPVCDELKLIGMITERDLAVRAVLQGLDPNTATVAEAMSPYLTWCFDDVSLDLAAKTLQDQGLRSLPVVNRQRQFVGMLSADELPLTRH